MSRGAPRNQVILGLVGTGPLWERRYRSAVKRLAERLQIRAVYDPVLGRAQHVASELGADPLGSLRQLFERPDLQGVLVLDTKWLELFPAELACIRQKPAFLAGSLGADITVLERLHQTAQTQAVTLMTEFSLRHTPATCRLRELLATRLGAVRALQVDVEWLADGGSESSGAETPGPPVDLLLGVLDWCGYVCGRTPVTIAAEKDASGVPGVQLGYRPDSNGKPQVTAAIRLHKAAAASEPDRGLPAALAPAVSSCGLQFLEQRVACEHGAATILRPDEIAWSNGTAQTTCEQLTAERSDAEVMLDQFCRRVVGGLVPIADVADTVRGLRCAHAIASKLFP